MLTRFSRALSVVAILAALLTMLLGQAVPVAAEPSAEQRQLAARLVKILRADAGFDQVVPAIVNDAKTLFIRTNPDLSKDISEVADEIGEELKKTRGELTAKVVDAYAETFTVDELKQIIAFYESPVGRKLNESVDTLTIRTIEAAREWGDRMSQDIVGMIRAEMLKRGHNL